MTSTEEGGIIKKRILFDGIPIDIPVVYEETNALLAVFPARYDEILKMVGRKNVKPVSICPGVGLLGITIFDYTKSPVGQYQECAISVPVKIEGGGRTEYGFFAKKLMMDTDLSRRHAEFIFGYSTHPSLVSTDFSERQGFLRMSDEDGEILSARVRKIKKKRIDKQYITFLEGKEGIRRVPMDVKGLMGQRFILGTGKYSFNREHPMVKEYVAKSILSERPLWEAFYEDVVETLHDFSNL
jgi:hypothetical protein